MRKAKAVTAWAETKDKEKAEIARLADEAREKAKAETMVRKKSNAARRVAEEAVTEIRVRTEVERAKRESAEAETSARVEAKMKEKAERMRKTREEKAKAEVSRLQGECY